jgi:hypothetical protein
MRVHHTLILNQHSRPALLAIADVLIVQLLSVHVAAVPPYNVEFNMVEHLAQLLELVFVCVVIRSAFLALTHPLKSLKIGAVLYETRDVDLRADEITYGAAGVEEWGCHEEVHEGRAIAATGDTSDTDCALWKNVAY